MTCRGFSGSSQTLGRSYVAYFFLSCLKVLHKSYVSQDMIFRYTWLGSTSPSILGSTCRRAYRVCLRPFREVRLQRDKFMYFRNKTSCEIHKTFSECCVFLDVAELLTKSSDSRCDSKCLLVPISGVIKGNPTIIPEKGNPNRSS